ncbi:MAG TPA: helix-turn-helix domain-containing protein [Gemmatirosa sp.]
MPTAGPDFLTTHAPTADDAMAEQACAAPEAADARVEALVHELIGRVADKWTMIVLEVLTEHGELRFTRLGQLAGGVSQKMLTQTLRQMERDGLVVRTVHPVVPPNVEYRLTDLGRSLAAAFCGVWLWAEANLERIDASRRAFDARTAR